MLREVQDKALAELQEWHDEFVNAHGDVNRNVICAGLALSEIMVETFPLNKEDYITEKNQMKTSGSLINKVILNGRYGIDKVYSKEGGRTTRSTRVAAENLANRLNNIDPNIDGLNDQEREQLCRVLQDWLVDKVQLFFDAQRLQVEFNSDGPLKNNISAILESAKNKRIGGPVAQHLVGAKFTLRFPDIEIHMHSATTADDQLGRPGDFLLNEYSFHVTVAPGEAVIQKCQENLRHGYRPVLLVPENKMQASYQLAEIKQVQNQINFYSLESFISQNIEEIGSFSKANITDSFADLLIKYNEIIDEVEGIPSYKIEIPDYML